MPVMCGSTTHSTATAATAASAAVPPAFSISMAVSVASGCDVAAMPSQARTGERPGRWKSRMKRDLEHDQVRARRALRSVDGIAFEGDVTLRGADRDREAADHVDEADAHQQEE